MNEQLNESLTQLKFHVQKSDANTFAKAIAAFKRFKHPFNYFFFIMFFNWESKNSCKKQSHTNTYR